MTREITNSLVVPSIAVATPEEKAQLEQQTALEREWYREMLRYATNADILNDAWHERLASVRGDENFALIGRLRNSYLRNQFPPFLRWDTRTGLETVGRLWREELPNSGPARYQRERVRLAVTSLVRSEATQDRLAADPTKLAAADSTHTAGGAFDIDTSGYYLIDDSSQLISVPHPMRDQRAVAEISRVLQDTAVQAPDGHGLAYDMPASPEPYDPDVPQALLVVCDRLQSLGAINHIVEFAGTANQCVHISTNPSFEWTQL